MKIGYSSQYKSGVVILEEGDNDPEEIIETAVQNEAVYQADDEYLVIRFLGRTDECYTESAIRRSFKRRLEV